jgi:hypothetical protein
MILVVGDDQPLIIDGRSPLKAIAALDRDLLRIARLAAAMAEAVDGPRLTLLVPGVIGSTFQPFPLAQERKSASLTSNSQTVTGLPTT